MKIAIDPGCSGAIAWQEPCEAPFVVKMPDTPAELADLLLHIKGGHTRITCNLEKVHSMPKQGVSSTFKFGENFGMIQGVLSALYIPYVLITPQSWMKSIPGLTAGLERADRKRQIKAFVQRVYPAMKIGLQESDALGILWTMTREGLAPFQTDF